MTDTDTLNAETRAAYGRWLSLHRTGNPAASAAAYAEYVAARTREADAYAASRRQ